MDASPRIADRLVCPPNRDATKTSLRLRLVGGPAGCPPDDLEHSRVGRGCRSRRGGPKRPSSASTVVLEGIPSGPLREVRGHHAPGPVLCALSAQCSLKKNSDRSGPGHESGGYAGANSSRDRPPRALMSRESTVLALPANAPEEPPKQRVSPATRPSPPHITAKSPARTGPHTPRNLGTFATRGFPDDRKEKNQLTRGANTSHQTLSAVFPPRMFCPGRGCLPHTGTPAEPRHFRNA